MAQKIPVSILNWRKQQLIGSIMKPKTFERIKKKAMKQYKIDEERANKIAGRAYWNSVKVKASSRAKGYERRV